MDWFPTLFKSNKILSVISGNTPPNLFLSVIKTSELVDVSTLGRGESHACAFMGEIRLMRIVGGVGVCGLRLECGTNCFLFQVCLDELLYFISEPRLGREMLQRQGSWDGSETG